MMNKCPLCDMGMIQGKSVNKHHLVPKLKGGKISVEVHKICHTKLHSLWSENELRDTYNNWISIKKDDKIIKFITWVCKQFEHNPEFVDSNKLSNKHKKRRRK